MYWKLIGSIFIVAACGGFGWRLVAIHLKEERMLRQLIAVLDYMACELQYRHTPLPLLCRQAASETTGKLCEIFLLFTHKLEDQASAEVNGCMQLALNAFKDIPKLTQEALELLGRSLGRFDIQGQLLGLETVRAQCRRNLDELNQNKPARLRGYQTLGLCAGAALAILLL